jgi:hypothetical protein
LATNRAELDALCSRLIALLQEHEILPPALGPQPCRASLFDQGLVDSMGAAHLLELVQLEFGVEIAPDLLVGEMTTVDAICAHILAQRKRL